MFQIEKVFLKSVLDWKSVMGASSLGESHTWIDAAYAVHSNMHCQMCGAMSFGYGLVHGQLSEQKLNTKNDEKAFAVARFVILTF